MSQCPKRSPHRTSSKTRPTQCKATKKNLWGLNIPPELCKAKQTVGPACGLQNQGKKPQEKKCNPPQKKRLITPITMEDIIGRRFNTNTRVTTPQKPFQFKQYKRKAVPKTNCGLPETKAAKPRPVSCPRPATANVPTCPLAAKKLIENKVRAKCNIMPKPPTGNKKKCGIISPIRMEDILGTKCRNTKATCPYTRPTGPNPIFAIQIKRNGSGAKPRKCPFAEKPKCGIPNYGALKPPSSAGAQCQIPPTTKKTISQPLKKCFSSKPGLMPPKKDACAPIYQKKATCGLKPKSTSCVTSMPPACHLPQLKKPSKLQMPGNYGGQYKAGTKSQVGLTASKLPQGIRKSGIPVPGGKKIYSSAGSCSPCQTARSSSLASPKRACAAPCGESPASVACERSEIDKLFEIAEMDREETLPPVGFSPSSSMSPGCSRPRCQNEARSCYLDNGEIQTNDRFPNADFLGASKKCQIKDIPEADLDVTDIDEMCFPDVEKFYPSPSRIYPPTYDRISRPRSRSPLTRMDVSVENLDDIEFPEEFFFDQPLIYSEKGNAYLSPCRNYSNYPMR